MPHDLRAEPRSLLYEATGRWKNASDRLSYRGAVQLPASGCAAVTSYFSRLA
jgi:hypothetical protein